MKLIKTLSIDQNHVSNLPGQSLIEITVALGALSILLTVSAIAIIGALSNSQEARFHNQAGLYAQEGIDIVRQMRGTGWSSFDSFSGTYCMSSTCSQLASSGICGQKITTCGQNVGIFSREVTLLRDDLQCSESGIPVTKAIVTVGWSDSKCSGVNTFCRQVKLETCFANIYGNSVL